MCTAVQRMSMSSVPFVWHNRVRSVETSCTSFPQALVLRPDFRLVLKSASRLLFYLEFEIYDGGFAVSLGPSFIFALSVECQMHRCRFQCSELHSKSMLPSLHSKASA
mmetsp:Transcript_157242/g.501370  ORF Transcript_157242/g.501370 Transcript_157242/m.501370 type:complete len:108 (-) Transcript_157242:48-371(-)